MKHNSPHVYSRQATTSLQVLGGLLKAARKQRGISQAELAERLGLGRHTVMAIEKGDPKVSIGAVFEAAVILGVPLLAEDQQDLRRLDTTLASLAAVLPGRVGRKKPVIDDDF